ncbi:hypothetical protein NDU88_002443 [Pleurodeles waltl]|uniref:Uncharacterized protein n=1 Tax=Pleurodeles waltl TaxID=8319 RepID=A0AAV7RDX8_PLEWA|nr:hypothetical protein NDU88_002443 [Pleurodeles waltl]
MAPKATWNPGDKTKGVKAKRVGRDKGELPGVNKRLTSTAGKVAGKNMLSLGKDAKMSGSITTPPLEIKTEDNNRETNEKKSSPSTGDKQFQVQQFDQLDQLDQPTQQSGEGAVGISRPAMEGEDLRKSSASPKKWGKIIGKDPQFVDWGKDSSDKFYSLTEESDLSSGDHSFGGSDDSETSEAENKSSSNEPTCADSGNL